MLGTPMAKTCQKGARNQIHIYFQTSGLSPYVRFLSRTIYAPGSEICFGEIFVVGIELANFLLNRDILAFLCYELYSGCFW